MAVVGLVRVPLAVVDARLHRKLVVKCREPGRLVEQLLYVLVRAVGLHLQVRENDLLVAQQVHQLRVEFLLLHKVCVLLLDGGHHQGSTLLRMHAHLLVFVGWRGGIDKHR